MGGEGLVLLAQKMRSSSVSDIYEPDPLYWNDHLVPLLFLEAHYLQYTTFFGLPIRRFPIRYH